MNYTALVAELTNDPLSRGYSSMSDSEVAASLNTANVTETYERFISLRACADVLTDTEYAAFKSYLTTISANSDRVTDMVVMLGQPCADGGDTGGLDAGCDAVRSMLTGFGQVSGMASAAGKLQALGEHTVSRATALGLAGVSSGHIKSAREMMEA